MSPTTPPSRNVGLASKTSSFNSVCQVPFFGGIGIAVDRSVRAPWFSVSPWCAVAVAKLLTDPILCDPAQHLAQPSIERTRHLQHQEVTAAWHLRDAEAGLSL